jgi:hypothetical protein
VVGGVHGCKQEQCTTRAVHLERPTLRLVGVNALQHDANALQHDAVKVLKYAATPPRKRSCPLVQNCTQAITQPTTVYTQPTPIPPSCTVCWGLARYSAIHRKVRCARLSPAVQSCTPQPRIQKNTVQSASHAPQQRSQLVPLLWHHVRGQHGQGPQTYTHMTCRDDLTYCHAENVSGCNLFQNTHTNPTTHTHAHPKPTCARYPTWPVAYNKNLRSPGQATSGPGT